jgi:DNA polymerase III delta prime subunit
MGKPMAFVRKTTSGATYTSPQELYRDLPRRPGAVPGLWAHQAEALKAYVKRSGDKDLALELPTGTGKTLTGLLIAEWTRRSSRKRVIYACPTQQLAQQVAASAHVEGIDVALLIGSHREWPDAAHAAYEAADAIGVTTYSSIFNTNPHLADADLILFDDAHAGEQYVGERFAVEVKRWRNPAEYETVLASVAGALDGVFVERLRAPQPDPSVGSEVRLVVPLTQQDMVARLDVALSSLPSPLSYQVSMIRAGLASCLVYVSYASILVRPYLPPTHRNALFTGARQRLYVSATLGNGGELERAFGRSGIVRLALPDEATAPRYGRRFFVFPEISETSSAMDLARDVVEDAGKALVLAPRTDDAMQVATALAQPGWPVLGVADVPRGMGPFADLPKGTCGLAARYDGLDLPGDACRVVVLDGVPDQDSLQERFFSTRARAGVALAERIRTRIIQGAGRCTRGPEDTAVVVVLGGKLSRLIGRPEFIDALDPELQAEVRFGRENSQGAEPGGVIDNVHVFLNQGTDDTWRTSAEPTLTEYRREASRSLPAGTEALSAAVEHEVAAWVAADFNVWADAAASAHEVARLVGAGGTATAGYRAFWMYLEAVWSERAATNAGDRAAAHTLVQHAEQVMGLGSWVREMAPLPTMPAPALSVADTVAVNAIANRLAQGVNQGSINRTIGAIHAGLAERDPGKFEPALTELGKLTGATATKSPERGRCDSTWCWDNELWLALEAKSDHEPTGVVPHKDVRQANDQLRLLASDRGVPVPPAASATVIISAKPAVDTDGIKGAEPHVHLITPSDVQAIAYDVTTAWSQLLVTHAGRSEGELRAHVASTLSSRGALPTQLYERVTRDPVAVLA